MKNIDKLPNKLAGRNPDGVWSNNWAPNFTLRNILALKPDIVHMHLIGAGAFPIRDFPHLGLPIVWTLHDMMAFTGGCHYSGGCLGFRKACGECPKLGSGSLDDLSHKNWLRKKRAWERVDLTIVCPSNWMADVCRQSTLMAGQDIRVIHNGIDLEVFRPRDKALAREALGLSQDKYLVVFGAGVIMAPNKGLHHLLDALRVFSAQPKKREWELVVFGAGPSGDQPGSIPMRNLGIIRDDQKLALLYSAADVFCAPSLEENLATTAIESLASGTPVVSFRIGGFPDIVDHLRCGYLATPFEVESLVDGLQYVYSRDEDGLGLRAAARKRAEDLFDGSMIASRHLALYNSLTLNQPTLIS